MRESRGKRTKSSKWVKGVAVAMGAAALVVASGLPAAADWERDGYGRGDWNHRHNNHGGHYNYRPSGYYYAPPPPVYYAPPPRVYYAPPPVYYAPPPPMYYAPPPPVYYAPPPYYYRPGVSLNLTLPLR